MNTTTLAIFLVVLASHSLVAFIWYQAGRAAPRRKSGFSSNGGTVTVKIRADTSEFEAQMKRVGEASRRIGRRGAW